AEPLLGLAVDLPDHLEVVIGVDRAVLGRQVAHMAERGQHLIAPAEVLVDGLGLGGGLDDDDVHACLWVFGVAADPPGSESGRDDAGKMGKSPRRVKWLMVFRYAKGPPQRAGRRSLLNLIPCFINGLILNSNFLMHGRDSGRICDRPRPWFRTCLPSS